MFEGGHSYPSPSSPIPKSLAGQGELMPVGGMFLLSQVSLLKKRHHQGSLNGTHFGGIKQYKSMAILRDFPYNNALSGLVSYNDPWSLNQQKSPTSRLVLGNFPFRSWWIWPDASWNVPSPGHRDLKKNFVVGRIVDPQNRGKTPKMDGENKGKPY